jgi:hypothetical protein
MAVVGMACMAQETEIVVQVLNGKNGKPIANEHLVIFTGTSEEDVRQHKNQAEARTDAKGIALLSVDAHKTSYIQVWVDWHVLCQKAPNGHSYSVGDILKGGLSTTNNCGPIKQPLEPNHFVVFARPASFREKMDQ